MVEGELNQDEGILEHYLAHDDFYAQASAPQDPKAKKCLLHFKVLKAQGSNTFVKVKLETGRYHQIRAQFAIAGFPIAGDVKYGAKQNHPHIYLHHNALTFSHPVTGKTILCESMPKWAEI